MRTAMIVTFFLLFATEVMADLNEDKAVGRCQGEVQYSQLSTGYVNKVVFPNDYFYEEDNDFYYIDYKGELKAGSFLKKGGTQALDVRCKISRETLKAAYVKVNNKDIPLKESVAGSSAAPPSPSPQQKAQSDGDKDLIIIKFEQTPGGEYEYIFLEAKYKGKVQCAVYNGDELINVDEEFVTSAMHRFQIHTGGRYIDRVRCGYVN